MAKNTINTVVAKAMITQLAHEQREARQNKVDAIAAKIAASANMKRLKAINTQIELLIEQRSKLRETIISGVSDDYSVDLYNDGDLRVRAKSPSFSENLLVSEIIMLGHAGKTVEQIRTAIRTKYFN